VWTPRPPPNLSNYTRGRAFEYRTRNKMIEAGARYVMRAAQSKGAADLATFWPVGHRFPWPWLVQCKTGTARMSKQEKADFVQLAIDTNTIAVLAQPRKGKRGIEFIDLHTEQEIEL
jgi:hypothetical protein